MKNNVIIHAFISTALISLQVQNISSEILMETNNTDTLKFEQVFLLGLQGNIPGALSLLDSLESGNLTDRQKSLKQKFYARFRTKDENYDFNIKDIEIIKLIKIYQNYWRSALLDNLLLEQLDSSLSKSVTGFLKNNYTAIKDKTEIDLSENFPQYLQEYLQTKGIFSAAGKTGMFFDLLLHAKETGIIYDVTTPEDTIKVKVIFMEDIISNGWEDYATFGKYYPGGWATNDALYCVKESYDLESENFLVSYLKHEGKHFADYRQFPKLGGTDLEYRAKLVELSEAKTTLYSLINFFSRNAKYDRQNPHGFANFCVLRDLSKLVFNEDLVNDIEKWKTISVDDINNQAIILLKKNTAELIRAGAENVTDYIK